MKTATYHRIDGSPMDVSYDENQPCIRCGLPVLYASMGGTVVCSWCDCGNFRTTNVFRDSIWNPFDKYSIIRAQLSEYYEYYEKFNEVAEKYPYIKEEFDVERIVNMAKNHREWLEKWNSLEPNDSKIDLNIKKK